MADKKYLAGLDVDGNGLFSGNVTANSFVKSGGTSSQFLKADGSVDSATYSTFTPTSLAADYSYTEPTHAFSEITDVVITTPLNSQVLIYDGTNWINGSTLVGGTAEHETLTATGGETFLALTKLIGLSYKYQIFRNGQLLAETTDYTLAHTTVTTITFVTDTPLAVGEFIDVYYNDINAPGNYTPTTLFADYGYTEPTHAGVFEPVDTTLVRDDDASYNATQWDLAYGWGDHAGLYNNYAHPTGDGNLHVPANGTTNNNKVLTAGATAGLYTWETPSNGVTDHTLLSNIGTNTHAQIDTHLGLTDEHIDWSLTNAKNIHTDNYTNTTYTDLNEFTNTPGFTANTGTVSSLSDLSITALASEINLLDLAGLTAGWVLSADTATTASWKAPAAAGALTLPDLTDVVSATNTNSFVLVANGSTGYVGRALLEADISDLGPYTNNAGTVTSVAGTGTISGLTLSGTVTTTGNLTLGGSITGFLPLSGGTLTGDTIITDNDSLYFGTTVSQSRFYSNGVNTNISLLNGDLYIQDGISDRFHFERTTGNITAEAFIKRGSDDTYVLLAGGGTTLLSGLGGGAYLPLAGGTMTGDILMTSSDLIKSTNSLNSIEIYNGSNAFMYLKANHATAGNAIISLQSQSVERLQVNTAGINVTGIMTASGAVKGADYYLSTDRFLYTSGNNHVLDLKNVSNATRFRVFAGTNTYSLDPIYIGASSGAGSEMLFVNGDTLTEGDLSIQGTNKYIKASDTYLWSGSNTIGVQIGTNTVAGVIDFRRWLGGANLHDVASIGQTYIDGIGYGLDFRLDYGKTTSTAATTSVLQLRPNGSRFIKSAHTANSDNFSLELFSENVTGGEVSIRFHNSNVFYSQIRTNSSTNGFYFTEGGNSTLVPINASNVNGASLFSSGTISSAGYIPFINTLTGYKSWLIHHPNSNSWVFAPSTTIDQSSTWDWANQIVFSDVGTIQTKSFISTEATAAPFSVASTAVVTNLNSDYLDGLHSTSFLRSDTTDTISGAITHTGNYYRFNDNIELYFGTNISQSYIYSDGTDTRWRLTSGNLLITDGATTRVTFTRLSGNVTANDFILSSDERLKSFILPIRKNGLEIEYREYELNHVPGKIRFGVVAQEIEEKYPELVTTDSKGMKSVSYTDLLVREVSALKDDNKELKNRLDKLEYMLNNLI